MQHYSIIPISHQLTRTKKLHNNPFKFIIYQKATYFCNHRSLSGLILNRNHMMCKQSIQLNHNYAFNSKFNYLVQAIRPGDRHTIAVGRRNQAQRSLLRRRTMPLPIKVHFSTQLTVPPRILTRHMIHRLRRAILHLVFPGLH